MSVTIHARDPRFMGMFFIAMGAQTAFIIILTWIANPFSGPLAKKAVTVAILDMTGNSS